MNKTKKHTIIMLKSGYNHENSLKDNYELKWIKGDKLTSECNFGLKVKPELKEVWWKEYFGLELEEDIKNDLNSGILFLDVPIKDENESRTFVFCFGHIRYVLKDEAIEYNFGLKVALNSLDNNKIRDLNSRDNISNNKQITQGSNLSTIEKLNFDSDSHWLKSISGYTKDEYKEDFKAVTGRDSLSLSLKKEPKELVDICKKFYKRFISEDYKKYYPDIDNVMLIKCPIIIEKLNNQLLVKLKEESEDIYLAVPEIIDYSVEYFKINRSEYDDISLSCYIEAIGKSIDSINIEKLKKDKIRVFDEESCKNSFSVYKCLFGDVKLENNKDESENNKDENKTYHLYNGNWYEIETDHIKKMKIQIDKLFEKPHKRLINFNHKNENEYNKYVANKSSNFLCLDCKNISPDKKSTQIEPCDLYNEESEKGVLYHVKIGIGSSKLSHLFNQGINSIVTLKQNDSSIKKMDELIKSKYGSIKSKIDENKILIYYVIVTPKDPENKSENLPYFSKLSLYHTLNDMKLYGINMKVCYVIDQKEREKQKQKKQEKQKLKEQEKQNQKSA
ncbi:MAG: TIGR04141 family sporadically distributed protein [Alphaproteobacteria bacterium]|nr:TIGR04141 family sporadically distributed protein [Alphaproteobacteria bacterium]